MPPPVQHKAFTLSKDDDLLSETPQQVSSDEEPPIEMTSWSIMVCSIKSPESLPPMPTEESDKNEDIIRENEYLEGTNKEERENVSKEARKQRNFEKEQ